MLSPIQIRDDWYNRNKFITVAGLKLNEKEVKFLINILYGVNSRVKKWEWCLRDEHTVKLILEDMGSGKQREATIQKLIQANNEVLNEL